MKITLHGAAGEVTGSAYHVEVGPTRVLVDCGLFQGGSEADRKNRMPRGVSATQLHAVVLTHAHLDHTGRLPLLAKNGYRGPIYATEASLDLTRLILRDAAHLQKSDTERENRRRQRAGKATLAPLYTAEDVDRLEDLYRPLPYEVPTEVAPGVTVRLVEAGHILGSTSIELRAGEDGRTKTVVFSGDLGPRGAPLLRDPVPFREADLVFLESTYGDRDHRPLRETLEEGRQIVKEAVARRARILVPSFAIGRTQQILYHMAALFRGGEVPPFPIYLDSPMAIEATRLYGKHRSLFDEEAVELLRTGQLQESLASVQPCATADESRALNRAPGPCMIIAGAGMCNGGRILHHLRHNLWKPETSVVIVGYQSEGTLGRQLVDRKKQVRIFGEQIAVRARIHTLGGFSAHAGQSELLRWLGSLAGARPRVVLTHGEERGREPLARLIEKRHGLTVERPRLNDVLRL